MTLKDRVHELMHAYDKKAKRAKQDGERWLADVYEDVAFQLQEALADTGDLHEYEMTPEAQAFRAKQ